MSNPSILSTQESKLCSAQDQKLYGHLKARSCLQHYGVITMGLRNSMFLTGIHVILIYKRTQQWFLFYPIYPQITYRIKKTCNWPLIKMTIAI